MRHHHLIELSRIKPPNFLGFFSGVDDLVYRRPPALLPAPPLSSLVPLSSGACKHGSLCAAQKSCAVTAIAVFRKSCEPAELASRAASNPWKKTALLGAERTKSLEENSISGCRANKIPGKNSTCGCRANKIIGVAVSYSYGLDWYIGEIYYTGEISEGVIYLCSYSWQIFRN